MLEAAVQKQLRDYRLDISLAVPDGTILALMGENGAGKSTTLNIIAGITDPDAGSVRLNGSRVCDSAASISVPVEDRNIGYVLQRSAVFPHMTVSENIAFGPRARHRSPEEIRERTGLWIERLGLADLAAVRAAGLSGGQKQRVALARALATDPALLMLDEPFAGLDAESTASVKEAVRTCVKDQNIPCILVTHHWEDALDIGNRVVTIEKGRITRTESLGT